MEQVVLRMPGMGFLLTMNGLSQAMQEGSRCTLPRMVAPAWATRQSKRHSCYLQLSTDPGDVGRVPVNQTTGWSVPWDRTAREFKKANSKLFSESDNTEIYAWRSGLFSFFFG